MGIYNQEHALCAAPATMRHCRFGDVSRLAGRLHGQDFGRQRVPDISCRRLFLTLFEGESRSRSRSRSRSLMATTATGRKTAKNVAKITQSADLLLIKRLADNLKVKETSESKVVELEKMRDELEGENAKLKDENAKKAAYN